MMEILLSCALIAQLPKNRVHEVPASAVEKLTAAQRDRAKSCAARHGVRWRIVPGR